jgi:DNA polymerase-3 subunit epsilon
MAARKANAAGMREIVFDTETTGLNANGGDRLVELGCVELHNHIATGRTFHAFLNPGRTVPADAVAIHGLDDAFLSDKPVFAAVVDAFLDFVEDSPLVAHNATFDRGFINMELSRMERPEFANERFVDTLVLARRRHPAGPNSLDALCARYRIDNSARTKHGALLDAEILAEVYVELLGGRQADLGLSQTAGAAAVTVSQTATVQRPAPLPSRLSEAEAQAHQAFVKDLGKKALWLKFSS